MIDQAGRLLHSYYANNQGKPLESIVSALADLYARLNPEAEIACSAVTGYGEQLLRNALRVDIGEVETVAHLKAAEHFAPGVSFVLDIGGQDMKCFHVRDGVIESIVLNEACSSGCGSFIENFAHALEMSVQEFAALGLKSQHPVNLGTRCTVFMNSKVKQAQKEGSAISDISAGISFSVVKNALFKVIRLKHPAELGSQIVVQGGTFCNDSVLRALELTLGREVIRPDIAGLMGAYGAALLARDRLNGVCKSSLLSATELRNFKSTSNSRRCQGCGNQCLITTHRFSHGGEHHAGNRCERGAGRDPVIGEIPNLYTYKLKRLFDYSPLPLGQAPRGSIGLPRVLNLYEDYPFWFTFFSQLGYRVVLSAPSSHKLYENGMDTIPSDSICYPAKLVHGHILDLLRQGLTKIFYPCVPYNIQEDPHADNCFNCPVVTSYPETVRANIDALRRPGITFIFPFLPLHHRLRLIERLTQELAQEKISRREVVTAVDSAYHELDNYKKAIRQKGQESLRFIREKKIPGIVLAGRPYHIDPEIHHGLPDLIQSYGVAVLSEDSVLGLQSIARPLRVVDQWVYHSRLYAAAEFCCHQSDLQLVQLNSFGCGLDAVTTDQVREILDKHHKIFTTIKLDEISNLGAAKIRIRSLLAACCSRTSEARKDSSGLTTEICREKLPKPSRATKDLTVLAPQLSPMHFQFMEVGFRQAGIQLELAPMPDRHAIEEGLKYVNNDACFPAILVVGQLLQALQSGRYNLEQTAILLSQTGGGCRATNYVAFAEKALHDAGFSQVPILSLGRTSQAELPFSFRLLENLVIGTLYGDLLMRLLYRTRPYEQETGSAQSLFAFWSEKCRQDMEKSGRHHFRENVFAMVRDFDRLPIRKETKPRVGIVGEILVKYHPTANNQLVELLEAEGAEAVVPDLTDFFLYCAYDGKVEHDYLSGRLWDQWKGTLFIKAVEYHRRHLRRALESSHRFSPPFTIEQIAGLASRHISLGHLTGEGWLLTGEMVELIHSGVKNIICMQPFACLPNHITGKGMIGELRRHYPGVNIVPIDYDPGASEVNQLNRIKLMLAVAEAQENPGRIG